MYLGLKSTLLSLFPLQHCRWCTSRRFLGQFPKVQVPLPCSEFASDQYASNLSGKSWRHPLAWSFLKGCPDWAFRNTLQYYLSVHIAEVHQGIYRSIMFLDWTNQFSSLQHLHLATVCHAYTYFETHALPFCILLEIIKGFLWRYFCFDM